MFYFIAKCSFRRENFEANIQFVSLLRFGTLTHMSMT